MKSKLNWKMLAIQHAGNAALLALGWYWLGLKVATTTQVASNAGLAVFLVLAWSVLDAYALGDWRKWIWAIPVVLVTPLIAYNFGTMILIPLLWILFLLPTAAVGAPRLLAVPNYLLPALGLLFLMAVVPISLLGWNPKPQGFTLQAISFGGRAFLAFIAAITCWTLLLQFIGRQARTPIAENLGPAGAGNQPVNT